MSTPKEDAENREVWSVCNQIKHLSSGERAALRRMELTKAPEADGIVEKLLRRSGVIIHPDDDLGFEMWRLVVHAASVISGTGSRMAHSSKRPLGRAFSVVGVKSNSINRLLTSRGPTLADQIRRAAYLLAGNGDAIPVNLAELRDLAHPDVRTADKARRTIARAYFAAEDLK
ncbi:MAG: type I-E CRISPR-associated protein Cse2/CasB [Janthinobacterium lividum]